MESKYCKFCDTEHPTTTEFWYRLARSPRCKLQVKTKRKDSYNPEKASKYNKEYRESNKEYLNQQSAIWRTANLDKHRENSRNYYYENRNTVLEKNKTRHYKRLKVDLDYKLKCYLRTRIYNAIKRDRGGSAVKDLGCSIQELRQHLESLFQPGMTWDNYGTWHIDHIQPLASFDLTDSRQVKIVSHYTNLQPLWAEDNLSKSDKVV